MGMASTVLTVVVAVLTGLFLMKRYRFCKGLTGGSGGRKYGHYRMTARDVGGDPSEF